MERFKKHYTQAFEYILYIYRGDYGTANCRPVMYRKFKNRLNHSQTVCERRPAWK